MATINSYATLTQAIGDWTHRANLITGAPPLSDYFIQAAQEAIQNDVFDLNFGNGIQVMETSYGPYPITNGVVPVPTDYLAPKVFTVADGEGAMSTLSFKAAAWIYDRYPLRQATGIPAFIARDVWQQTYTAPQAFTCTPGQTVFTLGSTPTTASLVLVALDGVTLYPTTDYTIAGNVLTLTSGALGAQVLSIDYLSTASGSQSFTASSGQTSFALYNSNASVILVTLSGVLLTAGTDYNVSGGFITLVSPATAGQMLLLYYATGSVFVFGPYPDSGYIVQGTYYQSAPVLSYAATQTTNWMAQAAPMMFLAACMIEAGKFLKDAGMMQTWAPVYEQRLKALVDRDKAERWSASTLQVNVG